MHAMTTTNSKAKAAKVSEPDIPPGAIRLPHVTAGERAGWVRLVPEEEITGRDIRHVRKALNEARGGTGDLSNATFTNACQVRIAAWNIPYRTGPANAGLPIPRHDPMALDLLWADDYDALERLLTRWAMDIVNFDPNDRGDNGGPGSPHQPASE